MKAQETADACGLDKRSADYWNVLNVVASCSAATGDSKNAISVAGAALSLARELFDQADLRYGVSISTLASAHVQGNNYAEGERLYKEAMANIKHHVGEESRDFAICLDNLAHLYRKTGRREEADKLNTRALEILKRVVGDRDPDYAISVASRLGAISAEIHDASVKREDKKKESV